MLLNFPLMLIPLAIYNFFLLAGDVSPWEYVIVRIDMISGGSFALGAGESLIVVSLFLLFIELVKATRGASLTIVDHLLSTLVFVAFLVEFLLVARAATSTFFLLAVVAFIDVIAGYAVSIRGASRDIAIDPVTQ